jgi:hypothetical protein
MEWCPVADNPSGLGSTFGRRPLSTEATLASIEMQLFNHGKLIEKVADQVGRIDGTLTEVKAQVGHLVTKEACAEGRKALSDDLKARMDGDREITGMNITLPALLQQYARSDKPTPVPSSSKSMASKYPSGHPKEPKTTIYYVKAVSSIVSLTFAILTITFFAFKMMGSLSEQQRLMQTIQRDLEKVEAGRDDVHHAPRVVVPPGQDRIENPPDGP